MRIALILALVIAAWPQALTAQTASGDGALERSAAPMLARAEALYRAENFEAALVDFTRAHQVLAGHPRQYVVLHNIALCHERLFRYDAAMRFYERYLREGNPDDTDRASVEATVRALAGLLGRLHIRSSVPAQVWLNDRNPGVAPGSFWLSPGSYALELRAPDYESVRRSVLIGPRDQRTLVVELERKSSVRGLSPVYFWSTAALSAAAAGVATVFGVRALTTHEQLQRDSVLRKDTDGLREETRDWATRADIFIGVSALSALAAAVLFVLTDWHVESADVGRGSKAAAP